jgi:hypothetical protein
VGTSSANPFKLSSYSSETLTLVTTLRPKATAVTNAIAALRRSSSPYVPALGAGDATLADLVGDWLHLGDFTGDVANAFFQADQNLGERPLTEEQRNNMVISLDDDRILTLGHVGYADRDVAIAEAKRLVQDMNGTMTDGRLSKEEMADFAARARRGQNDPAFSVAFVEGMGVDGMVKIPHMIEMAWPDGDRGRNRGWGQEMLAPFAAVLGTAMDTRAATRTLDRHDPDNENLADSDRLSEAWVDEFESFWQPDDFHSPNNFHLSLLVKNADLPTDVLVNVANRQLDYLLAHDATPTPYRNGLPWGIADSAAEINILGALGKNDDASLQWLSATNPGDGTLGYPGRTANNMTLLLSYHPNTDNPLLGQSLATVVDNGLQHWDQSKSDPLFETVIDTVGPQGKVYFQELLPTLGEGARTHIDQLAARTNEVLPSAVGQNDQNALRPLYNAHDFTKVLMGDDAAATAVYQGTLDYMEHRLAADTGDGLGGEARAIGGLVGMVTEADENAAVAITQERIMARQSLVRGMGFVKDVAGIVPIAGNISSAVNLARAGLSAEYRTIDWMTNATNADYANIENVRAGVRAELSSGIAAYEYGVKGTWTSGQVHQATQQALQSQGLSTGSDFDFFADGTTGDRRPIKAFGDMSESERRAYTAWLNSDQVGDKIAVDRTVAGQRMDEVMDTLEHR